LLIEQFATPAMKTTLVGRSVGLSDAASLAKKMVLAPDLDGVVLHGFLQDACGNDDLLVWARKLCKIGEPVKDELVYYEGYEAVSGESFGQQLQRQLAEDLLECGEALLEDGLIESNSDLANGSPSAVKDLQMLLEQLMQLHESCFGKEVEGRENLLWKVKVELNQDGGCTKFHDDGVDVRFVMTLSGDGTVLADSTQLDWDFYNSSQGRVPALQENPDLPCAEARDAIQAWNQQVSMGEITTEPGDLTMIKGRRLTKRPCVHRAPYSAGQDMEPIRLLITIDRIPPDELQHFVDLDFGEEDSEAEEHMHTAHTEAEALLPISDAEVDHSEAEALLTLLPGTVSSGSLGAVKTSLAFGKTRLAFCPEAPRRRENVLQNQDGLRVAVIVKLWIALFFLYCIDLFFLNSLMQGVFSLFVCSCDAHLQLFTRVYSNLHVSEWFGCTDFKRQG
jgi:hypothetical protein